ncbi:MFS transporter [Paraburkholderia sp.]|uniref:MFS transporter n=1 Tax=Paraburkholderia sp. TaxID=1926495 RepID=UPI003D6F7D4F
MSKLTGALPATGIEAQQQHSSSGSLRVILLASLGGALEGYEYLLYGLFASYISAAFFPTGNAATSLASTFAVYASGYFIRPIGGIVMGHFGDKFGRRKIFLVSMLVVSMATIGMGLMPSYASAGIVATISFVLLRLVQGFGVGGEVAGAITYAAESAGKRLGLACGVLFGIGCAGSVFASTVNVLLHTLLPTRLAEDYAWRFAFVAGGVLGFIFLWARRYLRESAAFEKAKAVRVTAPFAEVIRDYKPQIVLALSMMCVVGTYNAFLLAYLPAYLIRVLHYSGTEAAAALGVGITSLAVFAIGLGALADITSRKWMFRLGALCMAVGAWPMFHALATHSMSLSVLFGLYGLFGGMTHSSFVAMLAKLFPTHVRFTGIAFCYNIGLALFQGVTPIAATLLLLHRGGSLEAPALVLTGTACIALAASLFVRRFKSHL